MVTSFSNPLPFSSFSRSFWAYFFSLIQDMIFRLFIERYNDIGLRGSAGGGYPTKLHDRFRGGARADQEIRFTGGSCGPSGGKNQNLYDT